MPIAGSLELVSAKTQFRALVNHARLSIPVGQILVLARDRPDPGYLSRRKTCRHSRALAAFGSGGEFHLRIRPSITVFRLTWSCPCPIPPQPVEQTKRNDDLPIAGV